MATVKMNVLWNGNSENYFDTKKGVRQGGPISPCIFVMCMDKLSHLISDSVNKGKWKSLKTGRKGPKISHHMFADDLLLFGEATENQLRCVNDVLNQFCDVSGQRISKEKPKILFSKNTNDHMKRNLTNLSGFQETYDLGKYLGIPLTGMNPRKKNYQDMMDKIKSKLVAWKGNICLLLAE